MLKPLKITLSMSLISLFFGCGSNDNQSGNNFSTSSLSSSIQSISSSSLSSESLSSSIQSISSSSLSIEILPNRVVNIEPTQIDTYMNNGVKLIDVRQEYEWKSTGIINGSLLITSHLNGNFVVSNFVSKLSSLDITKNSFIAIICNSGNRSIEVVNTLNKEGFLYVYNVEGGIVNYINNNLPINSY